MKELEHKYRKDILSVEELHELRQRVNVASDTELERQMREAWMNDDIDMSGVDDACMERMKKRIDARTMAEEAAGRHSSYRLRLQQVMRVAAAILLPVFLLTTFYLYRENHRLTAEIMTVNTAEGERANITLPDGTAVALNASSTLSYAPHLYNKDKRCITFDGEGYFRVAKNKDCPFLIDGNGLEVQVLGTTFNLNVRRTDVTAELVLEEGSVQLQSTLTGESVVLVPRQKAVLNQQDGRITVTAEEDTDMASAWNRREIMFRNARFSDVIRKIEATYGIRIETDYEDDESDLFTGTLTTSDIFEVLRILERTYDLAADIQSEKIVLAVR